MKYALVFLLLLAGCGKPQQKPNEPVVKAVHVRVMKRFRDMQTGEKYCTMFGLYPSIEDHIWISLDELIYDTRVPTDSCEVIEKTSSGYRVEFPEAGAQAPPEFTDAYFSEEHYTRAAEVMWK